MAVNNRFIPNIEAAPLVETDIFDNDTSRKFALVAFGLGMRENDELFSSYLKLRANVYVYQTGMLPEEVLHDNGTETDEDDERSSHFLVVENRIGSAAAVACIRLIEKSMEHPGQLPVENFFPEAFEEHSAGPNSIEVSRFISCLDSKPDQLTAIMELFKSSLARIRQNELGPVYAVVEEDLERSLGFLGAPPRRIAEPQYVEEYNDSNVGIEIDTEDMASAFGAELLDTMDVSTDSVRYWGNARDLSMAKKVRKSA